MLLVRGRKSERNIIFLVFSVFMKNKNKLLTLITTIHFFFITSIFIYTTDTYIIPTTLTLLIVLIMHILQYL